LTNARVLMVLAEMSASRNVPPLGFTSQHSGATVPNQDEDTDIQHIARELIARYAGEAELIAAGHADTVLDQGDIEAFEIWRNVMIAVHVIQDKKDHAP
jgi:hypothetical protein